MIKLALFDIDFTLTRKETLLQFYKFMIKKHKSNIKFIPQALFSGICYGLGIYKEKRTKEIFMSFIEGITEEEMKSLCDEFYNECLKNILYKDGLAKIEELKQQEYMVILISASPEFYLNTLYEIKSVDKIMGTRVKTHNGRFMNVIEGYNCKGEEKITRLNDFLREQNIENVDYENSYMFSDSLSDTPLLELVGNPYLINYTKKTNYKVLKWE